METASESGAGAPQRLGILDGLRGIAILLVFGVHLYTEGSLPAEWLGPQFMAIPATGHYGVGLFFFLSGFCLLYPYAKARFDGQALPTLGHFIRARALKILPSYYVALFGALIIGYAPAIFSSHETALRHIGLHVLLLHALFQDTFMSIIGPLWSLGIEVELYAAFPLLAWCLLRRPLLTTFCALAVGVFARKEGEANIGFAALHFFANIDFFVSGMLAAFLFRALATRHQKLTEARWAWAWTLLAAGGVLLYVVSIELVGNVFNYPLERYMAFPLTFAFFAITLGSLFALPRWQAVLSHPILLFYARISYNFYLWHLVVRDKLIAHGLAAHTFSFVVVSFIYSTILATVLTYAVERPFLDPRLRRDLGWVGRRISRRPLRDTPG